MVQIVSNFQTIMGKAPTYLHSSVGLVGDGIIVLTYNKSLNPDSIPATGDFSVAGTAATITEVTIHGPNIRLAMSSDIVPTDVLTISYTKGANPIQDSSVRESVNLVTESISNYTTLPIFVSAEIGRYDDRSVIILMDKLLDETEIPLTIDFAVDDGAANAVTKVTIKGQRIYLELTNLIETGDTVTVGYTKPGINFLVDLIGHEVATFSPQSVTNNV